ncbi:hypothetical protein [Streptomyces albus]|uniref:hypothetical protein n=1 Tax=Streptomyces sp. NRRL F-5917 TaxID=1463873 RepID=UPI000A4AA2B6|nr:hypothetical protein [Streptomyces sp. NRRL F-5917]
MRTPSFSRHVRKSVVITSAALIGMMGVPYAYASAQPSHTPTTAAQKIVGKDKYGKWTSSGALRTKCRFYIALSVGKTAYAAGQGHCKSKQAQVVVAAISVNNKKVKHTVKRGWSKGVYTKAVKVKNPKGKQKICAFGWLNHPTDDTPVKRSEAKVCIKR